MSQVLDDSLNDGREAARKHAWRDAYELLQKADAAGLLGAEDLAHLGEAAWWTGRLEDAIDFRERAYAAHVEAGEPRRAALLAMMISGDHAKKGAVSVAGGWLSRATRLLADQPEGIEHGHLALARGTAAVMMGELKPAQEDLARAHERATRFGERKLEARAMVVEGTVLVMAGQVSEGLALLDEATAAAVSGELEPLATGMVYCVTIHSCQTLGDCGRAAEWTTAANRWCDRLDVSGFPGACRVHRAEIMRLQGDWDRAEEQAVQACDELGGYFNLITSAGFYEIGEIRRRRGDFAEAEEAYRKASELGHPTGSEPGVSLLRLAQGKVDSAAAAIKRELANEGMDPLTRARLLPAQVEIALAAGELARARRRSRARGGRRPVPGGGAPHAPPGRDAPARARSDPARRTRFRRRAVSFQGRTIHVGEGRRALRDGAGTNAARHRLPRGGRRAQRARRDRRGEGDIRAPRRRPRRAEGRRAPRRGRDGTDVHVHGHRRLDQAARGARRREVAEAPEVARPQAARPDRGSRRRGHQADRRRLLRRVRLTRRRDRCRHRDPALTRRGADRTRRAGR